MSLHHNHRAPGEYGHYSDDEGQLTSPGRTARARRIAKRTRKRTTRARTHFVSRDERRGGPRGSARAGMSPQPRSQRMTRSRARTRFVHRVGRRAIAGPRHKGPRGSAWLRAAAKPRRGGRSRRLVTPTSPARHCRAALAATFSRHSHAPPILRIPQIAQIARR